MQAAIIMLDTNLKQRRNLSYSELGFAYRMRMELMNRRGRRSDLYKDGQRIDSLSEAGTENSQSRRTVSNLVSVFKSSSNHWNSLMRKNTLYDGISVTISGNYWYCSINSSETNYG